MLTRTALALCLIAASCREHHGEHISKISHGFHTTANVPGHEEVIEISVPKGVSFDPRAEVTAVDEKGRSHQPKEVQINESSGKVRSLRVRVALPDEAQVRTIRFGEHTIDVKNSRVTS